MSGNASIADIKRLKNSVLNSRTAYVKKMQDTRKFRSDVETLKRLCKTEELYDFAKENKLKMNRPNLTQEERALCEYKMVAACCAIDDHQKERTIR
ncbi:MAG: hypothetical protein J6K39_00050 [Clostridia bacterium]|nr:hypothetical protein [Clostridia bacterium]